MNDKEAIFARKSTRKFDMTPLDGKTMEDIRAFLAQIKPLHGEIRVEYEITASKNASVKAPHCLAIYSENKGEYLINAGFMFQQFCLYLTQIGLGSCWVGMGKPDTAKSGLEYVIMIVFGRALDSPYRKNDEFSRKPLSEIANAADERLEAARLAPSSMNSQPWRFVLDDNRLHVYCVNLGAIKKLFLSKFNRVDIGIALCHLYVMDKERFKADVIAEPKELKGCSYICSL